MTTATKKHVHRFVTDSFGKSTCPCGRVEVSHIEEDMRNSHVEVLASGDPNYIDPEPAFKSDPTEVKVNPKVNLKVDKGKEKPVPARPKKKKELWNYFEANKEQILTDYRKLANKEFFKRWGLSTVSWQKLKVRWSVVNKVTRKKKTGRIYETVKTQEETNPAKTEPDKAKEPRRNLDELSKALGHVGEKIAEAVANLSLNSKVITITWNDLIALGEYDFKNLMMAIRSIISKRIEAEKANSK